MHFGKILMTAFAAGVLGNEVPTLPKLADVADAVAPVTSDAPVFRGRGAKKEEEAAAAVAVALAEATGAAAVALAEAADVVSDEVTAAGSKAGLRGAAVEETTRHLEQFKYERATMKVTTIIDYVHDVPKNSPGGGWFAENKHVEMHRTSRSSLYEAAKETTLDMKASIEHSMTAGASFPIKVVDVNIGSSLTTTASIERSVKDSSRFKTTYAEETQTIFESKTSKVCASQVYHPGGSAAKDQVVFTETVLLGHKTLRVDYFCRSRDEYEKLKAKGHVEGEITVIVGVDYQYYRIKLPERNLYLKAGVGIATLDAVRYDGSYAQQWVFDRGTLVAKSGLGVRCANKANNFCTAKGPTPSGFSVRGTQLKFGRYCLEYTHWWGQVQFYISTQECNGSSVWQKWTITKV